ncbi:hypothetical protein ACN20G_29475 (plasmid) [Streptomyces sp. BI20]|uniref:hypothetical protein n=1 Tax=Streptomyces sp. BI20 TaxID=3403460 RepID=UPI003C75CB4A
MPSDTSRLMGRRGLLTGGAALAAGGALSAAGATPARAESSPTPAADPYLPTLPHQIEAEQMVDYLRTLPIDPKDENPANKYKLAGDTRTTVLNWGRPGVVAEYRALAQCSTFVTKTLMRAYGEDVPGGWATDAYFRQNFFPNAPTGGGKWAPSAEEFQAGFKRAADILNIQQVTKPVNLRPGDLVAIDYNEPDSPYTGHIVMIREAKGVFRNSVVDAKLGANVTPRIFEVIDCTHVPHGDPEDGTLATYEAFPDTRRRPTVDASGNVTGWVSGTGVGYGHMIFYSDNTTGLFAGYRWSVNSPTPHPVSARPISAGRVYLG